MSVGDIAQLITALAAVGALVFTIVTNRKMGHLEHSTNSKMDRLLDLTAKSSEAAGELKGRALQKAEGETT